MSDEPVFRLHGQVAVAHEGRPTSIDTGMVELVSAVWQLGIGTQSCCEQDYAIIGGRPVVSDHAYLGLTSSDGLIAFCEALQAYAPADLVRRLRGAAVAEPGRGRELESYEDHRLLTLSDRWSVSLKVWPLGPVGAVTTLYVAFPLHDRPAIETALTCAVRERKAVVRARLH